MRKLTICLVLAAALCVPVRGLEISAPEVPAEGAQFMPAQTQSFGEALIEILTDALVWIRPDLKEAAASCLTILAFMLALSFVSSFPGHRKGISELAGTIAVGTVLLQSANSLISLGADTVAQLSEYGKLLLPVMAGALAAQGGVSSAAAIYTGTAFFNAVLSGFVSKILVPMIYVFLALAVGSAALDDAMLKKLRENIRALTLWCLKTALYVYTGYISITGVVSGTTDAGMLKAAKLTISGAVPVVGGILSDVSESVLVSAATVKNAAGIYGMLAVIAVWVGPFLQIGVHYLMLKALNAVCAAFPVKTITDLIGDFGSAMGLLLAMTGSVCLMLIISTICFMKGVGL